MSHEAADDEQTLRAPFWNFLDHDEDEKVVQRTLRRRFPETYALLSHSLETADPMDVVYPGNPEEYADVVRELIVLLAPVHGDVSRLDDVALERLLVEGLARCFGEEADESRVKHAVQLLRRPA